MHELIRIELLMKRWRRTFSTLTRIIIYYITCLFTIFIELNITLSALRSLTNCSIRNFQRIDFSIRSQDYFDFFK